MPFGSIFGALFFGVFCTLIGVRLLGQPPAVERVAGLLFMLLGMALAIGLLRGRSWARWAGALVALTLVAFGLRQVAAGGGLLDHLLVFAALATTGLLIAPVTGRPHGESGRFDLFGWVTAGSATGLLAIALFAQPSEPPPAGGTLPASAISRSVPWSEFRPGLERAQAADSPTLVTFVTDWCPYCQKMNRSTWRDAAVVERLEGLVTVKVDAELHQELAAGYGVTGYPAQLLLAPDGSVISRHDGFQTSRQLLRWLDRTLGSSGVSSASF
jgi:thiol:disulfide interchange protein